MYVKTFDEDGGQVLRVVMINYNHYSKIIMINLISILK